MKTAVISRVRNEIDIIVDTLVVLDDGSSDGTYDLLLALQAAGLPLVVISEPSIGYEQSRYMSRLLHMAVEDFKADWILPLDADEVGD